ncbi:MAG: TetR/AcrR family transcriptional regulator [Phycisphaeraceae bacterium]
MAQPARSPNRLGIRWRGADAQARRELIIDVAMEMLHRHGPAAVTMRRVAHRLGVGAMTLYTYIDGQDQLRMAMIHRGFDALRASCQKGGAAAPKAPDTPDVQGPPEPPAAADASTTPTTPCAADTSLSWRDGAKAYVQFALDNPKLYELMFSTPVGDDGIAAEGLDSEFRLFFERVRTRLIEQGWPEIRSEQLARQTAGRYWITLHGLASLAVAQRLGVLHASLDQIIDDLLQRVAPDVRR